MFEYADIMLQLNWHHYDNDKEQFLAYKHQILNDQKLSSNYSLDYSINVSLPRFDNNSQNNKLKELISDREIKYI